VSVGILLCNVQDKDSAFFTITLCVSVGILLCKFQDKDSAFFTITLYVSVGILLCKVQDKDSAFFTISLYVSVGILLCVRACVLSGIWKICKQHYYLWKQFNWQHPIYSIICVIIA
jgi:hypothetical protein